MDLEIRINAHVWLINHRDRILVSSGPSFLVARAKENAL